MRKGISEIIIAILLLMIAVSLVSALYLWSTTGVFKTYPQETISRDYMRQRACLGLENINKASGTATLKNCGLVPLSNLTFYVDGEAVLNAEIPEKLEPSETSIINFSSYTGEHGFIVVSDFTETPYIIR